MAKKNERILDVDVNLSKIDVRKTRVDDNRQIISTLSVYLTDYVDGYGSNGYVVQKDMNPDKKKLPVLGSVRIVGGTEYQNIKNKNRTKNRK